MSYFETAGDAERDGWGDREWWAWDEQEGELIAPCVEQMIPGVVYGDQPEPGGER